MTPMLYDMHCHLDFLPDPGGFARQAQGQGLAFFSNTVTPDGYVAAQAQLGGCANVRVGVGMHPWWVTDDDRGREEADRACSLLRDAGYVGEIGLDFGKRHADTQDAQVAAFQAIARACAREGGKVVSVHAVKSADAVLDILEETGCLASNDVVMHWFSGSDPALRRAIAAGCWFSVGERMLATGRGREYVRRIPAERLLLETDLPPEAGAPFAMARWKESLERALASMESLRQSQVADFVAASSSRLLR